MVSRLVKSAAALGLLLTGCNSGISDRNLSYISADETARVISEGQNTLFGVEKRTLLIDSRQRVSYKQKHILGAVNIPFGQLFAYMYELEGVGMIVVYGETTDDSVALAMSKELMELGFNDVRTLHGGFTGWEEIQKTTE